MSPAHALGDRCLPMNDHFDLIDGAGALTCRTPVLADGAGRMRSPAGGGAVGGEMGSPEHTGASGDPVSAADPPPLLEIVDLDQVIGGPATGDNVVILPAPRSDGGGWPERAQGPARAIPPTPRRGREMVAVLALLVSITGLGLGAGYVLTMGARQSAKVESGLKRIESGIERMVSDYGTVKAERDGLRGQVARLSQSVASLSTREKDLARVAATQDALLSERNRLGAQVVRLKKTVASLRASQAAVLERVTRKTTDTVIAVEKLIAMTGLDVERMLAALERADRRTMPFLPRGRGGPFLALAAARLPANDPLVRSVTALDVKMGRWHNLQRLLRMLPLAPPLDSYRLTSRFGRRLDPMRRRWSRHSGVDLANRMRTPVLATAPGTVVFAGWRGGFGRMVEIDHGLGLRTRYGHLKKILVRVGQRVTFRQKIALLGSSGRSTGPHVHYEVRLNGRSVDPARFMRAGKYVFRSP